MRIALFLIHLTTPVAVSAPQPDARGDTPVMQPAEDDDAEDAPSRTPTDAPSDDAAPPSQTPADAPSDDAAPPSQTPAEAPFDDAVAAPSRTPPDAPSDDAVAPPRTPAEAGWPVPAAGAPSWVPASELRRMRPSPITAARWTPSRGVELQTADDRFSLRLRLRAQMRYELRHDTEPRKVQNVFGVRRARIQFIGHLFNVHNKYYLQLAVAPRDMDWTEEGPTFTPIRNWEIRFDYLRDLTLTLGQMKKPFNRQRVISSGDLQMPDRTQVTAEFNIDRDVGIMLSSDDLGGVGVLRYRLGIYNGEGRDAYRLGDLGFTYVARVEIHPFRNAAENWDYDEVDWSRHRRPALAIGLGYAYDDRAQRERGSLGSRFVDGGTANFHHAEADVMLKVAGLSLTSEFQFRDGRRDFGDATIVDPLGMEVPAPRIPARSGLGYYVQAGFLIPRQPLEITARWGQMFGLGQTSLPDADEVGGGFNWYIGGHSLKLQTDYMRLRSDVFDVQTQSFHRQSWAAGANQVRLQLQLAF